jgi:hypothetical protein
MGLRTQQDNPRLLTNKPSPSQSNMKDKHRIGLASPPDREKLVAEIFLEICSGQKSTKKGEIWEWSSTQGPTESLGS